MSDSFRAPINLLGFGPKRHAMIGLFPGDSDLKSLFALPRDQLQEVTQLGVALPAFRSASCKDFAGGILAFKFPDSHLWFEIPFYSSKNKSSSITHVSFSPALSP
jgi:hypothetical protein